VSEAVVTAGRKSLPADIASLAVCSLVWGTTWRAIKLELGVVPPAQSVVYRFALASLVLVGLCASTGKSLRLSARQHVEVLAWGASGFSLQYGLVYVVEQTMPSGALAVMFAATTFFNLILFRLAMSQRASGAAWAGALMGLGGVAAMSLSQLGGGGGPGTSLSVIGLALAAVGAGVLNNFFAARAHRAGVAIAPGTALAMGYGSGLMALWVSISGQAWRFEASVRYVGGLVYLALFGSVVAFLVYYGLARRRGFSFASYVAALTPPTAMIISSLTEQVRWGPGAFAGLALVLGGQVLMIRGSRSA
jgi:drug/metabolite transporter (DMT)-like permease